MSCLVIGYGNTLCGDDGLGPMVAQHLETLLSPQQKQDISVITLLQLDLILANRLKDYSEIIFIDAQMGLYQEDVMVEEVGPWLGLRTKPPASGFSGHFLSPRDLLQVTEELYKTRPRAWIVAVRGYRMEIGEGLSSEAQANIEKGTRAVRELLDQTLPLV